MRKLEKTDKCSKSLLANVLDLEDDFLIYSNISPATTSNYEPPPNQRYILPNTIRPSVHSTSSFPHAHSEANIPTIASSLYQNLSPNLSHIQGIIYMYQINSAHMYITAPSANYIYPQ